MLSYIASNPMEDLIQNVCNELKITILSRIGKIDFLQYIKDPPTDLFQNYIWAGQLDLHAPENIQ